jgi:hypothetical protein
MSAEAPAPDPEAKWPPRFDGVAIAWFGVVLLLLFGTVAAWFRDVFDTAELFAKGSDASQHVAAYILFILGLFCLYAGVWFALIEARVPPSCGAVVTAEDLTSKLGTVVEKLRGNKVSTILFSIGFALLAAAAAGSGIIDITVGDSSTGSSVAQ